MPRLTPVDEKAFTQEQRDLYNALTQSREPQQPGLIGGPFDAWLTNGEMGRRIVGLGNMFRFKTSVDRRYVELVILVTGQFWQAQFEWFAHEPMAREAGLPESVINSIKVGETPIFTDPADRAAFFLAKELHHDHQLSEQTFQAAIEAFSQQGVAELVNLAGYYTMVSMTLNTFEVPLPKGEKPPFD